MKKVLVIIPYFGKFPSWFQVFLNSCKESKILDFLILTDDKTAYKYPLNFSVKYCSFQDLQNLVKNKIGADAYIDHPYKLCDYKSLYGYFFKDEVQHYDYWAHSDIDIIFGKIDLFLKDVLELDFDRMFSVGHFSIYKNEKEINTLFQKKLPKDYPKYFDINFVKNTSYPCHFDEVGMNIIFKNEKKSFFEKSFHRNINLNFYNFSVGGGRHTNPTLIISDDGEIYTLEKKQERVEKKEYLYVHIQNRKFAENILPHSSRFIICRDGFIEYKEDMLDLYFDKYGLNDNSDLQADFRTTTRINTRKSKKQKFLRELKKYPFRSFYNIYHRFISIKYLKENNLF